MEEGGRADSLGHDFLFFLCLDSSFKPKPEKPSLWPEQLQNT